jgi:hypothetical protein
VCVYIYTGFLGCWWPCCIVVLLVSGWVSKEEEPVDDSGWPKMMGSWLGFFYRCLLHTHRKKERRTRKAIYYYPPCVCVCTGPARQRLIQMGGGGACLAVYTQSHSTARRE